MKDLKKMNLPVKVSADVQGYKKRKIEIIIIQMVSRSTTFQSGFAIYQKLGKINIHKYQRNDVCCIMYDLYQRGYLIHKGFGKDGDSVYAIK